ncbi:alkaline phosphatase [Synechococcus sp. H55.7]|uniref:alkaline phosphatase n=1 Tax=unclassified Synechococcus TaxID=2626047 RepID=UPI0039C40905
MRNHSLRAALAATLCLLSSSLFSSLAQAAPKPTGNGAIFFHPDGTSASHWDITRILHYGPDGFLNWDRLPVITTYRGHHLDLLGGTSNGGAVTHATGTRVHGATFGLDPDGKEYPSANGTLNTIMEDAIEAGLGTALVQSGSIIEPGTAAFVAEAPKRSDYEEIALEVVESGVDIILGAGEEWLLPEGVQGRFGQGKRKDGRNLIEEAKKKGYAVVYTRDELLKLPADAAKVLGVFNVEDTFYDKPEEELRAQNLPNYIASAPTIAEMTQFALERISRNPKGFFAVIEEEGTDNMCNNLNASGCLEAMKRADDAIGVILNFIEKNPKTFMITTSDSNAGGMQLVDVESADEPLPPTDPEESGAPIDGVEGTGTKPFVSAPDKNGNRRPFAVAWATGDDAGSGVIARAAGLNAQELVPTTGILNTDIYRILYTVLFGERIPSELKP